MNTLLHGELSPEQSVEFERYYKEQIEPLYGDQTTALERITIGSDRSGYVLADDQLPLLGTLVIKDTVTSEEYEGGFSVSGVEIKTLTLFNPAKNSGKGLASILAEKSIIHAGEVDPYANIFVTVASSKPDSRTFFEKFGFVIEHEIEGAYLDGNVEAVMVREPQQ